MSAHVAIAGGGIIGLAAALELRGRGFQVTVVDRGPFGAEASSAAGGMLAPQLEAHGPGATLELGMRSRGLWLAFARQIEQATGADVDYRAHGVLRVAFDEAQAHHLDSEHAWQTASGLRAEFLDGKQARAREPLLPDGVLAALHLPDDHSVDPFRLMPALVRTVEAAGVTLRAAEVKSLALRNGRAAGLELSSGRLDADLVVNALGAWATTVDGFGLAPDTVRPIRGQMIELKTDVEPRFTLACAQGYLLGRKGGRVIAGSTKEDVGFDKGTSDAGTGGIQRGVAQMVPSLSSAPMSARWAGLRPMSKDELPLIGPAAVDGVFWATGHYRNGILLAPVTARLVGLWAAGQALPGWAGACNPARFARHGA